MLKFQMNVNCTGNDLKPIILSDYSVDKDLPGDRFEEKSLLNCYCNEEITFDKDARIMAMYEQYMVNDDFISSTSYDFNTVYHPFAVNNENRSFSILFDKYFDLSVSKTNITVTVNDSQQVVPEWWFIWFNGSHLFDTSDGSEYIMHVSYKGPDGFMESVDLSITSENTISSSILRFPYSILNDNTNLKDALFYVEEGQEKYNLDNVRFYRDNFVFTPDRFSLFLDSSMATVKIPISQKFATDLYQDNGIQDNFTDAEIRKSINRIVEMEKDVYHPVIWDSEKDILRDEVYKIRFNLHFRKHRGDNWLAEPETYWNGVDDRDETDLKFIHGQVEVEDEPSIDVNYFNNGYENKEELQSDLLTYLNFTDKDVRFQKNKLKKSFLRVMFYDSMNPGNQNMLAYYTVFLNSGEYFSEYARYIEAEGYQKVSKDLVDDKYTARIDLKGIKVDREPTKTSKKTDIGNNTPIDDIEAVRLSSQIVVEDKYMSDSSSEGFYLYLWKDNFLGTYPQDIYMKVEFNHAGYGRTIPFMCPFRDPHKGEGNGFKKFSSILSDWKDPNKRYGIRQYVKYSYIHFKYRYDKKSNRHIYYLDDVFYGKDVDDGGVYFTDNAITINLYEAKIV